MTGDPLACRPHSSPVDWAEVLDWMPARPRKHHRDRQHHHYHHHGMRPVGMPAGQLSGRLGRGARLAGWPAGHPAVRPLCRENGGVHDVMIIMMAKMKIRSFAPRWPILLASILAVSDDSLVHSRGGEGVRQKTRNLMKSLLLGPRRQ